MHYSLLQKIGSKSVNRSLQFLICLFLIRGAYCSGQVREGPEQLLTFEESENCVVSTIRPQI